MRITNSMMIDNTLRNLNNGLARVSKYHNQLASNRRIVKLSDDPIGVLNSMGARQQIRRLEQYQRNVDTSRAWVVQTESSVTEMEEAIVNIKELLTDAMGTENNDDKKIFATQIRQVTENILELCNSSMGDKYIFGGFNVTNQPFTAERDATGKLISVKYNGLDLTGKNVTFNQANGKAPDFETASAGLSIMDLKWSGQMDPTGTYTVETAGTDAQGAYLDFKATDPDAEVQSYRAYLQPLPDKMVDGETVKLELVTDKGESLGTVSWKNALKDADGTERTPVTAEQVLEALQSGMMGHEVGSSTAVNTQIVSGPSTPEGLKWSGTLKDTSQKYTMQTDGTKITFINSYGTVAGSVDLATLSGDDYSVQDQTSTPPADPPVYTINLKDPQTGMDFGTVTYQQAASDINIDFPKGVESEREKLAYLIGQSGFVSTKLGEESTQRIQFEIGYNMDIDVTFTGVDLVGTGEDNMFNVLINLANDLDAGMRNEDLTHYLTKLTNQQDRLLQSVMKCGNRTTKLETMDNRYSFDAINYEATRSSIEDIDQAKVITQMKYAEMIYKQALSSGAQIIQPTLMDFLR